MKTIFFSVCLAIAFSATQTLYAQTTPTTQKASDKTAEKTKIVKTWEYKGKKYTAKELEKAMKTDEELKMEFTFAKEDDPQLDVWFTEETNQLEKSTRKAEESAKEAEQARAEAAAAKELAKKLKSMVKKDTLKQSQKKKD